MSGHAELPSVLVTGASGFVGRYVVRELVKKGYRAVCLVRDPELLPENPGESSEQVSIVRGTLFDEEAVARAMGRSNAVIHLVGIIREAGNGQTFSRIHVEGTERILAAAKEAGLRRYVHMSALGARADAVSSYHRSKYAAERRVQQSGLDWTIFRPSIIHGPEAEFMRMLKVFSKPPLRPGWLPLWLGMPYFGSGTSRVQPVSVKDVAYCFVAALEKHETIGQVIELGGPRAYTWRELYAACSRRIAGKVRRQIGVPTIVARTAAATLMKTPLVPSMLRFDAGQVQMAGEDSICGVERVEGIFGIRLRDFEEELADYAGRIG